MSYLSKIVSLNELTVIGVYRHEAHDSYYALKIKKHRNKLNIVAASSFADLPALLDTIDSKQPALTVIDGKGVLNKKIDYSNEADINWRKNVDFSTLHHIEYKTEKASFISFSRRTAVDEVLADLQSRGVQVIDFFLGPLASSLLYPAIGGSEVHSNDSVLVFEEKVLKEIRKADPAPERTYTFDTKSISHYHLPLYGAAICFYLRPENIEKSKSLTIDSESPLYRKAFNVFGTAMLVFFFLTLLGSYFLTQHYASKNMELNQKNLFSNQTYEHITELQQQRERKMKILDETGQLSRRFMSFYVYELAKTIPGSVNLDRLDVFPVAGDIKPDKKVEVMPNLVVIKGATFDEGAFDVWLDKLKTMAWIKKFEIVSLRKDSKNIQQFEIKILISNV